MRCQRDAERPAEEGRGDGGERRRLLIEAGMLAFLVGLAVAFVASAPS